MVEHFEVPGEEILGVEGDGGSVGEHGVGLVVRREEEFGAMGEVQMFKVLGRVRRAARAEWIVCCGHSVSL